TRTVIAGVIVGTQKVKRRVEQARLLQPQHRWIGTIFRSQAAVAETSSWFAGVLVAFGDADLGTEAAAPLEDAQDVARLTDLETWQRIEKGHNPFAAQFVFAGRRYGLQALGYPVHAVALAVACPFVRDRAVVIQGRTPQHAAVGHHALA